MKLKNFKSRTSAHKKIPLQSEKRYCNQLHILKPKQYIATDRMQKQTRETNY